MSIESAGEKLKKIRQEKGITLEEVHKKTKVQLNILRAIEGESISNLNPIYLKGFLKIYCKFLGVDPKEYIPDYKEGPAKPLSSIDPQDQDKPLARASFMQNATLKLRSFRPNKKLNKIVIVILLILLFGVIISKIVVVSKIGNSISRRPKAAVMQEAQPQKASVQQAAAKPNKTSPKAVVNEAKFPKESSGGISLVISAKENCMLLVKVDGKVVWHRFLERGRSETWKAKEKIELDLGNALAVDLIVNGQRFSRLGRKNQQLKNIVITEKEGLKIPR